MATVRASSQDLGPRILASCHQDLQSVRGSSPAGSEILYLSRLASIAATRIPLLTGLAVTNISHQFYPKAYIPCPWVRILKQLVSNLPPGTHLAQTSDPSTYRCQYISPPLLAEQNSAICSTSQVSHTIGGRSTAWIPDVAAGRL